MKSMFYFMDYESSTIKNSYIHIYFCFI